MEKGRRTVGHRFGETEKKILQLIADNQSISIPVMVEKIGIITTAIEKHHQKLKSKGTILRVGSDRSGTWKIKSIS